MPTDPLPLDDREARRLQGLRGELSRSDGATQGRINEICHEWRTRRELLRPGDGDEPLDLVDPSGTPSSLRAPRWLCHLLGLRHACAHVLLRWQGGGLGRVFVLQLRSWTRPDFPGHLDISAGGHLSAGASPVPTAYRELNEELGVTAADLVDGQLSFRTGYEDCDEDPHLYFHNSEWRYVFTGDLAATGIDRIRFVDREVAGVFLCPEAEIGPLLEARHLPLASGLRLSLPRCL